MNRRGFTLIEMLVTISVFGLVLATLLAGLRIGSDSMERVERHIAHSHEMAAGLNQIRSDLSSIYLEDKSNGIRFEAGSDDGQVLAFCRLVSRREDARDWKDHLQHVRYVLEHDDEQEGTLSQLARYKAPVILDEAVEPYAQSILIKDVAELKVEYLSGNSWTESWRCGDKLPRAIRMQGKANDGHRNRDFRLTVGVSASEYFGEKG